MNARKWLLGIPLVLLCLSSVEQKIEARPQFKKVFADTYEKEFAGNAEASRCTVCHLEGVAKGKKLSTNYAEALMTRNFKDTNAIQAALRETEDKPSAIEGKTFGDLIREGRLPASKY